MKPTARAPRSPSTPAPRRRPAAPASPLVDAAALREALRTPDPGAPLVLLDASFDLADPDAGPAAYAAGHVPGALHAHLERDLCGPKEPPGPGFTGRHPLPSRQAFAATVGGWGIAPASHVVVMDRQRGMYAARLWWMLRWLGHGRVWVLDGGVPAWVAAGGELTAEPTPPPTPAPAYPFGDATMAVVSAWNLAALPGTARLVDARAPERFRGEVEPLDPVAGHIPGALNRPFTDNLGADGRFKAPAELRGAFAALLGDVPPEAVVHQCGSGVTACHNLLAMEAAGLAGARLYPGSWSEWSADPARPVARG